MINRKEGLVKNILVTIGGAVFNFMLTAVALNIANMLDRALWEKTPNVFNDKNTELLKKYIVTHIEISAALFAFVVQAVPYFFSGILCGWLIKKKPWLYAILIVGITALPHFLVVLSYSCLSIGYAYEFSSWIICALLGSWTGGKMGRLRFLTWRKGKDRISLER